MAAGRKQQLAISSAAVAVAVVAMLLVASAAAAQDCGVGRDTMNKCMSYCSGGDAEACCGRLKSANLDCLCQNYWNKLQAYPALASCANKIKYRCGINKSC